MQWHRNGGGGGGARAPPPPISGGAPLIFGPPKCLPKASKYVLCWKLSSVSLKKLEPLIAKIVSMFSSQQVSANNCMLTTPSMNCGNPSSLSTCVMPWSVAGKPHPLHTARRPSVKCSRARVLRGPQYTVTAAARIQSAISMSS